MLVKGLSRWKFPVQTDRQTDGQTDREGLTWAGTDEAGELLRVGEGLVQGGFPLAGVPLAYPSPQTHPTRLGAL